MSQSVILIADRSISFDEIQSKFAPDFQTGFASPERFVVESEDDYLAFDADDSIVNDYEAAELEGIPISNPTFYSLKFTDFVFLKKLLPFFADDPRIWVDDDHGHILPGPEFVKRMRQALHGNGK